MKKSIITAAILSVIVLLTLVGCATQQYPPGVEDKEGAAERPASETPAEEPEGQMNDTSVNDTLINPITKEPYHDIVEKRGQKTNITDFTTLLNRAANIGSYKYNITDTEIGSDEYQFFVLGRFIKMRLPGLQKHDSGEEYDEILLDRVTKTAFSHCSDRYCPKPALDKELEKVEYSEYYINDPMEYLYKAIVEPEYIGEEMLGNDFTKVFRINFEGGKGRIWLQEYYGYPLKIDVVQKDGTKRKIIFEEMTIDATRRGEIDLPFNFTVKDEGSKRWIFWEHYLGEWPPEGQQAVLPGQTEPMLGV